MPRYAIVGPDDTCEGVVITDAPDSGDVIDAGLMAGHRAVPITHHEAHALKHAGHHARLQHGRWGLLPEATARRLEHARGIRADHSAQSLLRRRASLSEAAELPVHASDFDPGPAKWASPAKPFGEDTWLGQVLPVRPEIGLVVRHLTEPEVDALADIMFASNAYDGLERDDCWTMAHSWYTDPDVWALVLDWQGQALQYEMIHFDDVHRRSTARGGFVTHVSRERPAWFWREASAPLFRALQACGYTRMSGHVRLDRKDWADNLVALYGGQNLGANGQWWVMRYELATMIERAQGWPARRTSTAPWTVSHGGTTVALREATDADLPMIRTLVSDTHAGRDRATLPLRLLEERWQLDNAAVLLASVNGAPAHAYVIRETTPTVASHAILTRLAGDAAEGLGQLALLRWMHAVGYTRMTIRHTARDWAHPLTQRMARRRGSVVVAQGEDFVVSETDLETAVQRPPAVWTQEAP